MKATSGAPGSHFRARLPGIVVHVSLALGIALALLFAAGPAAADGPYDFLVPIVLEEGRTPPDVVDPPNVLRDVVGAQETPVKLVGNSSEGNEGALSFDRDRRQEFTTGSNAAGYKLTSVQIAVNTVGAPDTTEYGMGIVQAGTSTVVGTLTNPSSWVAGIGNSFTGSVDLEPNTSYDIILNLSNENGVLKLKSTLNDGEDSDSATGWSIGNLSYYRAWSSSGAWTQLVNSGGQGFSMKMVINGYAKVVPALTSATIDGASLALNFDRDLDTTSVPAASRFTILAVGSSHPATGITVGTRQVRLTVPAVKAGQFVTVSYSKPSSNPLKGSNGVDVAAFSGQVVTNNTLAPPPDTPGTNPGTGLPRAPITYTEDGVTREVTVFSADSDTLYSYFVSECTHQRSVPSTLRDYSWFNADGLRMAARNGWKWVEVQNANGDVTHTRPMTVSECASLKLYQRQAFCAQYADDQGPNEQKICPTNRTW